MDPQLSQTQRFFYMRIQFLCNQIFLLRWNKQTVISLGLGLSKKSTMQDSVLVLVSIYQTSKVLSTTCCNHYFLRLKTQGTGMETTFLSMALVASSPMPSSPKRTVKETFTLTTMSRGPWETTWVGVWLSSCWITVPKWQAGLLWYLFADFIGCN